MAIQDLTPQLRTRLSRMERAVGWFVLLATALLAFGFGYYIYNRAETKGWFKIKVPFYTYTDRATGLKEGDPVQMMGFDVGQITRITSQPPEDYEHNVYVEFEIKEPYYGYLWTEGSRARVTSADFLGKRQLEVTKGTGGHATYVFNPVHEITVNQARAMLEPKRWKFAEDLFDSATNSIARAQTFISKKSLDAIAAHGLSRFRVLDAQLEKKKIAAVWNDQQLCYETYGRTNKYWLKSEESPALTERLEKLVGQIEAALPNFLILTNQLATVLSNGASLTANLDAVALSARPAISNLALVTAQLNQPGALGEWLLPTNINQKLDAVLGGADETLNTANTNLAMLAQSLNQSLENLSFITSNLNGQVQANTNILSDISRAIVDADNLVQGLKKHWFLKSAFKKDKETDKGKEPAPANSWLAPRRR